MTLRGVATAWLRRKGPRSLRTTGAVVLAAATVGVVLSGLVELRTDTSPASFLPASDQTLEALERSARAFGGDPVVVIAQSPKPGELVSAEHLPRLLALEGRLSRLPDVAVVYGPATALNQLAASSQNLLAELSGRRDRLRATTQEQARTEGSSEHEAQAAGDQAVADFDSRYGRLLVQALPAGLPTLHNQRFVETVLFDNGGAPRPQWRFILPRPDTASILVRPREGLDQAGTERLTKAIRADVGRSGLPLNRVTVSGAPAIAAALSERLRGEVPLLGALAVGLVGASYWLMPWRQRRRDRLIPLAVTLGATACVLAVLGWAGQPLTLALIAFLPILVGIGSDFPAYLLRGARTRTVLVTAFATAAAFSALAVSPLPFVRDLGLALAGGIVGAVILGLLARRVFRSEPAADRSEQAELPADSPSTQSRMLQRPISLVLAGAVALGGWGALPTLEVNAQPEQLAAGLSAVADARYVEQVLGSSGEVRVVLRGPGVLTPEALSWLRQAQDRTVVEHGSDLRVLVSLPDLLAFLGKDPTREEIVAAVRFLPDYLTGAVVSPDRSQAAISFGLRFRAVDEQVQLLDGLKSTLPAPPPGYSVELAGLPVTAARAYEIVDGDRVLTNVLGILVAGLVLGIGLRRRRDAMRAMLAAVLATGWGLAAAWALGLSLSPLTVALGSLTTATACEFTILLAGATGRARLRMTVGVAALSAVLGYAALVASEIAVIREFGMLLAASVGLSYLAARTVVGFGAHQLHAPTANPPPVAANRESRAEESL